MEDLYHSVSSVVWAERFWLTHNTTWDAFQNKYDDVTGDILIQYPRARDLWVVIPMALFIMLLRQFVEGFVWTPLGKLFGLRELRAHRPESIPELETYFRHTRRPTGKQTKQLSEQINMDQRRIDRWFRHKRNLRKSSALKKFSEGGWKFMFHLTSFTYGLYVLHDEEFFQDPNLLLKIVTYPHHHVKTEFYVYYIFTLGYWLSLGISLMTDVRRHDFYMMAVHHVLTCTLMWGSWSANYVRVGMVVLILHDFADFLLEITKSMKYAKFDNLSVVLFTMFFITWIYSRLYYFPRYVLNVVWNDYINYLHEVGSHIPAVLFMIMSLSALFVLHLIWTSTIVHAMVDILKQGDAVDDRSDSELELSSSDQSPTKNGKNGSSYHDKQINGYHSDKNQNCDNGKTKLS